MRKKMIAGNWKMHKTNPEAIELVTQLKEGLGSQSSLQTSVLVCPPFTALSPVCEALRGSSILVGAQNLFWEDEGAFTGEVSAKMIKSTGAEYVIVGHSERRRYFDEDERVIHKKIKLALDNGLKVVHCIGETLEEREQNLTKDIVGNQVEWDLKGLDGSDLEHITIAYEPVWAIGTGKTATPAQAEEIHAFIREIIEVLFSAETARNMTLLYGGSVKPENAASLLSQPNIDGALVGGACLKADSFLAIIEASESV